MIRIGVIGTGCMGNEHAIQLAKIRGCKVVACCDVDESRARAFAEKHDIADVFTSVDDLLALDRIDAVTNVTPDALHASIALKVLKAGKHILSEKPLATNLADARKMARSATKAGVINMVNFSYRDSSAIQKAKALVDAGKIGEVVHFEASYLQSWLSSLVWGDWRTIDAWLWRQSTAHGSHGVLGDIGVHILDFVTYPAGPAKSIYCKLKTFNEHKGKTQSGYTLDANDSAVMTVELKNGAIGTVHTSRWATGYQNELRLEIHGTKGALRIDLDKGYSLLETCIGKDIHKAEWKVTKCPATPNVYKRFVTSIRIGRNDQPDFARGAEIQAMLDACCRSNETGGAVKVR